jgi:hypothetical protein
MLKMLTEPPTESHHISLESAVQHISQSAHTGSLVYLISDFMDIEQDFQNEGAFSRLNKRCDMVVIAVNDPADKSIYPVGTIGFCKSAEKAFVNTESIAGRKAYADQWNENRRRLYEITSRYKVPMIEMTTESDIQRDLILGLKNISKGNKR